jgi:predicted nucleic acid-binding protein
MPIDRVVVNASPLIVLFRSGQAELLGQLWQEVIVPGAV